MYDKLWLIPLFPLVGSIINGLLGKRILKKEWLIGGIATAAVASSFYVSLQCFLQLLHSEQKVFQAVYASWMTLGDLKINWELLLDPLSALMLMVVTGVGSLIHLYSIGYMHGETGFYRFFSYLNLFVFSMLMLVLGGNALVMFIGWEGVGLCSYLLIGYYFEKKSAGDAAKKAFVVNRVGDFGFLLGLMTLYWTLGLKHGVWTINFVEIAEKAPLLANDTMLGFGVTSIVTLCFFVGATGKSAQIPLYTWLPDAMEGPTPVSALIHAATMVTAGVYMIGRMNVLFAMSPDTMMVVALIGAATAIFAASIGFAQNDIKRVLAYSTVSQLGFMFMAMGVGAFTAGIFHLMTHAFFKACLFLGSGSVIHAMHHALHHAHLHDDPQDMRNMGGLRKFMPVTWATYAISCLAIAGMPFFAGFFSKDEILWWAQASSRGSMIVYVVGSIAACMTAFYMFRSLHMTFHGPQKTNAKAKDHVHESPWVITLPLVVLALLATVGGFVGVPHVLGGLFGHMPNYLEHFLAPVFEHTQHAYEIAAHGTPAKEITGMVMSVVIGLVGIGLATWMYMKNPSVPAKFVAAFPKFHRAVFNKWYIDELYDFLFVNPCKRLGHILWKGFDVSVVDGVVNGVAKLMRLFSAALRNVQTGLVQNYAMGMVIGVVVIVGIYILR